MQQHTLADDNARAIAALADKSGDTSFDKNVRMVHDNADEQTPTTVHAPYSASNPAKTFSIIVLPDTQKYSRDNPKIFCDQTEWIASNKAKLNIQFVSQLGDIVDSHKDSIPEWEAASKCMKILDDSKIPYGIIPGNHDTDGRYREGGMLTYDAYFPASRYDSNYWYKGNRKNNQNNYQIINVQVPDTDAQGKATSRTIQMLFLNLEIEPSDNTLAWANSIVKKYPNIYTVVTTHKYLPDTSTDTLSTTATLDNERAWSQSGNTGQGIWDKLVKDNCNIRMVWNGHYHVTDGEFMLDTKNACGSNVRQIIQDYQAREEGGNGRLRIYTFDFTAKKIKAQTYSPHTKTYETDADSQFEMPFAVDLMAAKTAANTDASKGSSVSGSASASAKAFCGTCFIKPSLADLKKMLTATQYTVTQEEGTETPYRNAYVDEHREGIFVDIVSGEPLFSSKDKYDSHTGWPSFVKPIAADAVTFKTDKSLFETRVEVRSRYADSHLGHVFDDGPSDRGGKRYCMNSAAMRFIPKEDMAKEGYGYYLNTL